MSETKKVVVITGGARGIGLATARRFLREGYRAALLDIATQTLTEAAASLGQPQDVLPIDCDVSDPEQVSRAVDQIVATFGRIDALVNNAGKATFGKVLDTGFDVWREIMATNLDGPFICTQLCAPAMLDSGGGAIVNIASISGVRASLLRVAYGTSKAAIIHLTKQQAAELGDVGIRVNAIAPGPVDTEMAKKVHTQDIRDAYHDAIPQNRYGTEDEIANGIWFLCSDESSYINGQTIAIDGGFDATGIGLPALRDDK